jgi:hypothetical protein
LLALVLGGAVAAAGCGRSDAPPPEVDEAAVEAADKAGRKATQAAEAAERKRQKALEKARKDPDD